MPLLITARGQEDPAGARRAGLVDQGKRDLEVRHSRVEFLGDRWSAQIDDDEAGKTDKDLDRFNVVAIRRPLERSAF